MNEQIVIKDLLISYNIQGDGEKTLLFLHGWGSNKEIWQGCIRELENERISLYAIDLPGFGASQIPLKPMTVGDYAEIVAEFIKKLELKNVILIGHSFGGRIGIKLVSMRPELIEKLVLVDSAGFAMDANKKNLANAAAKIVKPIFKPKFMQGLRKKIYKQIGSDYAETSGTMTATYVKTIEEDLTEDLKKITVPTLIIFGEDDTVTPVSYGEKMHSLVPNSKFKILKQAGHFSFLDKPEEFVEVLNKFI